MSEALTGTATFREIYVANKGEWCRLLMEPKCWRIILLSGWGCWSHRFSLSPRESFPEFLRTLDMDYLANKCLGLAAREHDDAASASAAREWLLDERRRGVIEKPEARGEYDLLEQFASGVLDWEEWLSQTNIPDAYEFGRTRLIPYWERFWELLWVPLIVPALREMEGDS